MIPSRALSTVDRSFYCGVLADWAAATLLKLQRGLELPRRTLLLLLGGDIGQVEADDRCFRAAGTSGAGSFDIRWAGSSAVLADFIVELAINAGTARVAACSVVLALVIARRARRATR